MVVNLKTVKNQKVISFVYKMQVDWKKRSNERSMAGTQEDMDESEATMAAEREEIMQMMMGGCEHIDLLDEDGM